MTGTVSSMESVWDYPRPPRLERSARRVRVVFASETIVDTTRAQRVLETSHPPLDEELWTPQPGGPASSGW